MDLVPLPASRRRGEADPPAAARWSSLDRPWFWLGLLWLVVCVQLLVWLRLDRIDPHWDEAGYLNRAIDAYRVLHYGTWREALYLSLQQLGPRPTGAFVLLAQPAWALFGPRPDLAILSTHGLLFGVVLGSTFWLGRRLFSDGAGLLAAFLVATLPQVSILSRTYWPHFSVVAVAILGVCLLVASDGFQKRRPTLAFGLLMGVALLMRPVWPALFLCGPVLVVVLGTLWNGLRGRGPGSPEASAATLPAETPRNGSSGFRSLARTLRSIGPSLLGATALLFLIAGPYYVSTWQRLTRFVGNVNADSAVSWSERGSRFWYLVELPSDVSWFFTSLVLIGVAMALATRHRPSLWLLLALIPSYAAVSWSSNRSFYYFAPMYPFFALLGTAWIFRLRTTAVRRGLVLTVATLGLGLYALSSWPTTPSSLELGGLLATRTNARPNTHDWRMAEIAARIQADVTSHDPGSIPKVGLASDSNLFNLETFRFFSRLEGIEFRLLKTHDLLPNLLESDYLVVRLPRRPTRRIRQTGRLISKALVARFREANPPFVEVDRRRSFQGAEVLIVRRTRAATPSDIVRWVEALHQVDPQQARRRLAFEFRLLPVTSPSKGCLAVALGVAALRDGDFDEAKRRIERGLELQPVRATECLEIVHRHAVDRPFRPAAQQVFDAIRTKPAPADDGQMTPGLAPELEAPRRESRR